jgi:hypothetical protein
MFYPYLAETVFRMIAYDLQCFNGHIFEGWFEDEEAYLDQKKKQLIACPVCNDATVGRIPSTFAIKSSQSFAPNTLSAEEAALARVGKEVIDYVEKNFDDVGSDFTKEALKIHYGAAEPRNIRGVSTKEEEKVLKDEGVQFFKIPIPPRVDSDS